MSVVAFLQTIDETSMTMLDRCLAILWWVGRDEPSKGASVKEICGHLEEIGHPQQNASRLAGTLSTDRRTSKVGAVSWRLHPKARVALDAKYISVTGAPRPRPSDSVMPRELFAGTRGYLERVIQQVNGCYDACLYDGSAVMCRRLLETLIIEVYEHAGRATDIKGADGNFLMFSPLLAKLESDPGFHLSRNGLRGLRDFKTLGDLSAHNRRFNARKDDIDRIRDGLRVASEDLLHLARLTPMAAPAK